MFSTLMSNDGASGFGAYAPSLTGGGGTLNPVANQAQPQLTPIGAMLNGAGLDAGSTAAPIATVTSGAIGADGEASTLAYPASAQPAMNQLAAADASNSITWLVLGGAALFVALHLFGKSER